MISLAILLPGAGLAGYLLGSIPFGLVLSRMAGHGDIRQIGSGNIGATNVLRTGNKGLAAATLLLDGAKGAAAVLLFSQLGAVAPLAAGLGAVLGHNFPVWLKFKGGKGMATTIGVLLAVSWQIGIAVCLTWLATALLFRISSLSALIGLAAAPLFAYVFADWGAVILAAILAILGFVRHHANIARLLKGEEPRIGQKKKAPEEGAGPGGA